MFTEEPYATRPPDIVPVPGCTVRRQINLAGALAECGGDALWHVRLGLRMLVHHQDDHADGTLIVTTGRPLRG
ncbi:hypothetical protein [Streptomyces phytophilus]|uniref:hypothetical protein n=1 Tax=Streptomyces phytophilus TaxID=722715 RepID=UPI0015F0BB11|nr:hypothetical protein [Streptomyces phytophilus]